MGNNLAIGLGSSLSPILPPYSLSVSIHTQYTVPHQLPVESASSEDVLLTEESAVVLCLSLYAQSLNHLRQVDEVHELYRLVCAGILCAWGEKEGRKRRD